MLAASSTATLTRPSHAHQTRPAARAVPPLRVASRIAEPDGLPAWRRNVADAPVQTPPTVAQVRRILAGVRAGHSLPVVSRTVRMSQPRVLDAVVGVGSRMSQANKTGPKATRCLSLAQARTLGVDQPGTVHWEDQLVVVLGDGWDRGAEHGRDISRAYAAVIVADPAADERPVARWLDTLAQEQDVTYAHYAHLFAVAHGKLRTFTGLSDDRDVQAAYLRAFDSLADAVAAASAAVGTLCAPNVTPQEVLDALGACFWMVAETRTLAMLARATQANAAGAQTRLRVALSNLRTGVAHRPSAYFPRHLGDLTQKQFRAIVAVLGYHPSDMADAARSETDFADLGAALAAVRARMLADGDLPAVDDDVADYRAAWAGLED